MGFAEGTGLLWLAGMANGVRFFAPPYWKIEQCARRATHNPYYEGQSVPQGPESTSRADLNLE
jgi:type IV secretion system protein VirD4